MHCEISQQLGHKSYEPGMAAYKKIIEEFGEGMYSLLCQTVDFVATISSLTMLRNDSSSLFKISLSDGSSLISRPEEGKAWERGYDGRLRLHSLCPGTDRKLCTS